MKKYEKLTKSYESYLRQREQWAEKGYAMDAALSITDYKEIYVAAVNKGLKNIARTFAAEDRVVSYQEAARLSKAVKEAEKTGGFKVKKLLEEGDIGYEKGVKKYKQVIVNLEDYDLDRSDFTIKKLKERGLAESYNMLLDAGLSAREAGSIIDTAYREGKGRS